MTIQSPINVSVYDIDWDLHWTPKSEPRQPWTEMTAEEADSELALSREAGETVSEQEYLTTDLAGQPVRVVLLKVVPEAHLEEDLGAVYVFAL
ncbi:hypothetical protein [Streptomyces sp. NPDC051016]|uniref:hypothetical protein n=1 Tax=Streptomyces sp. NPDC051016 TaxID=3365638 RepID=UPI00378AFF1D